MYLHATYESARERQADLLREAARQQIIRKVDRAQRSAERPAHELSLLETVRQGIAAIGSRIAAL